MVESWTLLVHNSSFKCLTQSSDGRLVKVASQASI